MVQSVKKAEIYWNEVTNTSLKKRANQIAMPTYIVSKKGFYLLRHDFA